MLFDFFNNADHFVDFIEYLEVLFLEDLKQQSIMDDTITTIDFVYILTLRQYFLMVVY